MWDTQLASGMRQKIKVVDSVSYGGSGLELQMERDDKIKPHDITDDDVFKELINIVTDVFSNKSEKCMLTFELPVESNVLQAIRPDLTRNFGASSSASKSDLVIPLREMKNPKKQRKTKRKRKLIELIAKPSKYTKKKKFKKRLNPAQTMLHPNPGLPDLEKLPRTQRKRSEIHKVADEWDAEKNAHLQEASDLGTIAIHPSEDIPGSYNNLYHNFKEVLHSFEDIIKSPNAPIPSCEVSYHLEEIQNHVEAIRSLLQDTDSRGSWEIRHASTESSEGPRRKNKVGVKLIRVGAKISQKSSMQITSILNPQRKCKRRGRETKKTLGLGQILTQYQKVKKEETAIVQALLGKLGIPKDTKRKKTSSRKNKEVREDQIRSNDEPSAQLGLKPSSPKTYSNSSKETFEHKDTLSMDTSNLKVKILAKQFKHKFETPKLPEHKGPRRNRFDGEVTQRRQKVHAKMRRKTKKRASKNSLKFSSSMFDDIRKEVMGNSRENKVMADKCEEIEPHRGNNKKEALMRRIQSSAERLEQMHRLVEEKLNKLSLKEEQFQQLSQKTGELTYTDRDFDKGNMLESTQLNLSPEVEELIFSPYRPFNLEVKLPESSSFYSSNLKLDNNFGVVNKGKSPMNFDNNRFGRNHNYVCSYMMEMRGTECDLVSSGSMENQPGSEHNLETFFSSTILTNEFQEDTSSSRPDNEPSGAQSSLSSLKKDVFTENSGEIVEESLLTKPQVSNKNPSKFRNLKKKKRVITTTCALS